MLHTVAIMNPSRRKKIKGGKKLMAKRRKTRRHNPRNPRHNTVRTIHHYHNPRKVKRIRRRRNPSARMSAALGNLQTALPVALAVSVGLIGSRMAINFALPKQTGYVKGALQIGAGLVLSLITGAIIKKKPAIANGIFIGGLTAGVLQIADTATGTKYHLADIEGDATRIVYLPEQISSYLPATMSGYETRFLGEYETRTLNGAGNFQPMFKSAY